MTIHKRHPQRCLHSHICKWNKDNYQDCIDTDCASHRYTYSQQSGRDKVLDIFEAFEHWANNVVNLKNDVFGEKITHIIQDIREHPEWVIERGVKEGWWKAELHSTKGGEQG